MMKKHSAKNFIIKATSALAVSAFLCMSVSAEISHTVDYDYVNNTVTVSGKCEENAKYILFTSSPYCSGVALFLLKA